MLRKSKSHPELRNALSAAQVRTQMERILASEIFSRSERLSGFLRYVVERTLEGSGHNLKEQVIAQDVFGRVAFDGAADAIVRVEARRLRDKLREYYAENEGEPVLITLPKGSYVPSFERNPAVTPVIAPTPEEREPIVLRRERRWPKPVTWVAVGLVVVVAAITVWYAFRTQPPTPLRVRRLTSLPGNESAASLSPDGNFVAFSWSNNGPSHIFIKEVDGESLRRLTETAEAEVSPAWSPEGREIAFVRARKGIFIVSPLGGTERKIADSGLRVTWSSDARSVFVIDNCSESRGVACVYQVVLDTLEKRQITKAADFDARHFAASPDGRTLAVVGQGRRPAIGDIYLLPLAGGESRRLTTWHRFVNGIDWTPDSKYLFYSLLQQGRFSLWRTAANGSQGNGERIAALGETAVMPTVARGTSGQIRIAYNTIVEDVSLRIVDLNPTGPAAPLGTVRSLADATEGRDCGALFSPDGNQISFSSFRSGEGLHWLVKSDGADLRPLMPIATQEAWMRGAQEGDIRGWSPDGRKLALDLVLDGNSDIYVTDVSGGRPIRLTSEPSLDVVPSWSADRRWIYFASDRSGSSQLWKVPSAGGPAIQITFQGGFRPQASPDKKYIYYSADWPGAPRSNFLKRVPTDGGEETVVMDGVSSFYWSMTQKGIYFLSLDQGRDYLERYDLATGQRTRLGALPFQAARGFCGFMSVSNDGRFLIANHVDRFEQNLGIIDGFR
jgi:Tol biopolymer transport system component